MSDSNDEIDLYQLIIKALLFLNKNKFVLVLLIILGSGLAYFQIKKSPDKYNDFYQTNFYVKSTLLTNEEVHTFIDNLSFEYQNLDSEKYNADIIFSIKGIDPKKELSIDGLRSDIKVEVLLSSPQKLDDLTKLVQSYIESTDYYIFKHDSIFSQQELILNLLNSKLLDLGFDIYDAELATQLKEKANDDVKLYLEYIKLVEKKTEADLKLATLEKSIQFLPVEPTNKLIDTFRLKMLLCVGYGFVLTILGIVVLIALNFLKQLKTKK